MAFSFPSVVNWSGDGASSFSFCRLVAPSLPDLFFKVDPVETDDEDFGPLLVELLLLVDLAGGSGSANLDNVLEESCSLTILIGLLDLFARVGGMAGETVETVDKLLGPRRDPFGGAMRSRGRGRGGS